MFDRWPSSFPAKEPQNPADYEAIELEFVVREEPNYLEYLNWAYRYRKVDGVTTKEQADPEEVLALARRAYKAGRLAPKTEEELRWFTEEIRTYAFSPADTNSNEQPRMALLFGRWERRRLRFGG